MRVVSDRVIPAAAAHFLVVQMFTVMGYTAIRQQCTNLGCESCLRVIPAAAAHFLVVQMFTVMQNTAIRQHRLIDSIETALCAGDFEKLTELDHVSDYKDLFKACSSNDDGSSAGLYHDKLIYQATGTEYF